LPGCISQGKTKEEAIHGYIAACKKDRLSVPEERFDTFY